MKMPLFLIAITVSGFSASPALAQSFSGPRIEINAGLDETRFDLARYGLTAHAKGSGLAWGAEGGYDLRIGGNIVAGIDAGISFASVGRTFSDGNGQYRTHPRRDIELSARLGTTIAPNILLYGKAGYTNFQLGTDTIVSGITTARRANLDGMRLGAGVEIALPGSAYLKTEYRYSNYWDGVSRNDIVTGLGFRF